MELLQEKRMSVADICRITGISFSTISTWKKRNNILGTKNLQKIADCLDVPIEYLVTGDELYREIQWSLPTKEQKYDEDSARIVGMIRNNKDLLELNKQLVKFDRKTIKEITDAINILLKAYTPK